jgi:hypothetical protein
MTLTLAPAKLIEITLNGILVAASPQGGNALHRKKKSLRWKNNTNRRVGLYFREWYDLDDPETPEDPQEYAAVWPFGKIAPQAGISVDIPNGTVRIEAGQTFTAPVAGAGVQMVKYDVAVLAAVGDDVDNGFTKLDPIIVIDR